MYMTGVCYISRSPEEEEMYKKEREAVLDKILNLNEFKEIVPFSDLLRETFIKITKDLDNNELYFYTSDSIFLMRHDQECCEDVHIAEIIGDINDLIGEPIIKVSEDSSAEKDEMTWTFYNLATKKGHVTIRWVSSSNGYYSEKVFLYKKIY